VSLEFQQIRTCISTRKAAECLCADFVHSQDVMSKLGFALECTRAKKIWQAVFLFDVSVQGLSSVQVSVLVGSVVDFLNCASSCVILQVSTTHSFSSCICEWASNLLDCGNTYVHTKNMDTDSFSNCIRNDHHFFRAAPLTKVNAPRTCLGSAHCIGCR
jgi:hypothetical protein